MRKTSEEPQLWDVLQNISPVLLKTVKVTENDENLWNCQRREEAKEIWWLGMQYPGCETGTEKNIR